MHHFFVSWPTTTNPSYATVCLTVIVVHPIQLSTHVKMAQTGRKSVSHFSSQNVSMKTSQENSAVVLVRLQERRCQVYVNVSRKENCNQGWIFFLFSVCDQLFSHLGKNLRWWVKLKIKRNISKAKYIIQSYTFYISVENKASFKRNVDILFYFLFIFFLDFLWVKREANMIIDTFF